MPDGFHRFERRAYTRCAASANITINAARDARARTVEAKEGGLADVVGFSVGHRVPGESDRGWPPAVLKMKHRLTDCTLTCRIFGCD